MVNNLPLLIDGEFVESNSKDYLEVTNLLSQEVLCKGRCLEGYRSSRAGYLELLFITKHYRYDICFQANFLGHEDEGCKLF